MSGVLRRESLLRPQPGFRCGLRGLLVLTEPDFRFIRKGLPFEGSKRLFLAEVCFGREGGFVGPALGAPQAVMLLENLVAAGAREILVFGWCGALGEDPPLGAFFVPERALSAEGTSRHYLPGRRVFRPAFGLLHRLRRSLAESGLSFYTGTVVSTDAPYREDEVFLSRFREKAEAVDMETSALFSAAEFLGVKIAALHLVSDRLAPGGRETFPLSRWRTLRRRLFPILRDFWATGWLTTPAGIAKNSKMTREGA